MGEATKIWRKGAVLQAGAFNGGLGVHVASQEAIPLVLLIGQVDLPNLKRDAVQEIDTTRAFRRPAQMVRQNRPGGPGARDTGAGLPRSARRHPWPGRGRASRGRPQDGGGGLEARCHGVARPEPSVAASERAGALISAAERPVLLVGGECHTDTFREDLLVLSERWNVPVAVAAKMQDQFPNDHPLWIGQLGFFISPAQVALFEHAELFVALGTRLGELSSLGFRFPRQKPPRQRLIHVYPDPDAIGTRFRADVPVVASAHPFVRSMLGVPGAPRERRLEAVTATREAAHAWPERAVPATDVLGHAVAAVARIFPDNGIITTGSGNFCQSALKFAGRMTFCQRSLDRAAAADAPPLADAEGFVDTGDMVELQTSGPN
jgi:acetolactate synthase I/II/III large subunit